MSSMGELTFFLGLQVTQKDDGIFNSQDKYVDEILKKFGFSTVKTASTPIETSKPLLKDAEVEDVDVHLYRSMIGSLILISLPWQCKKKTIVANSTTKAEYVAAASCCGQVLWIQNHMLDYGYNFMNTKIFSDNESTICIVKNLVFHSKTNHIEIRHHFIRDSNEKKLIRMIKIYTYQNVVDLLTKAFDVGRFQYLIATEYAQMMLEKAADDAIQFWQTATASTLDNGEMEITAIIDGIVKIVTKASIRRHLKLEDSDGISNLPTTEIFEQLALMRSSIKQETEVPQPSSPPHTNVADEAACTGMDVRYGGAASTVTGLEAGQGSGEDIRARVEASEELVQRLQTEERKKYSKDDQANMLHIGNYKLQQLKRLSFDEIKDLFETTMRRANTFVPMETEIRRGVPELVADSSQALVTDSTEARSTKRVAEEELGQQSSKKQESDELSHEELQQLMIIVPKEGMNIEALQIKYPIIDWEVYTKDSRMYWKIIRVGNHTEVYQVFEDMLETFDRDDLVKLWSLVQERFISTEPTKDKEIEIWVELKRLFKPDANDEL
ncbi:hypothetical protein Tco_0723987 [Tanacetum coccineum]